MDFVKKPLPFDTPCNVVFVEKEITPYCRIVLVVEVDTGAVLLTKTEGNFKAAFMNGYSSCSGEVVISREEAPNGYELRTVSDLESDAIYCRGWVGKGGLPTEDKPRKRGGRKSYVKIHPEKLSSLPQSLVMPLVLLGGNISVNGVLKDSAGRRSLSVDGIGEIWGVSKRQAFNILGELKDAGAVTKTDTGYVVNKEFMGRG